MGNQQGRTVAMVNLFTGVIIGAALVAIAGIGKEAPLSALGLFSVCLAGVAWRVHRVFRYIP